MRISCLGLVLILAVACASTDGANRVEPIFPPDRPVAIGGLSDLAQFFASLQPCIRHARATYPDIRSRYLRGLAPGHQLSVLVRIRDGAGTLEQVFVAVHEIDGPLITGVVASDVSLVNGFQYGDPVRLSDDEILDWVISTPDGSEEGNLVGKYIDMAQDGAIDGPCEPVA